MREILFRGKRCDNGEWVEGFYVRADHHWHKYGIHKDWIICSASANGGWFALLGKHAVKAETVSQFTGLYDKNGKRIWEGDVFKFPDEVWESYYTSCGTEYNSWEVENYGVVGFSDELGRFDFVKYKFSENTVEADLHENRNIEFHEFVSELEVIGTKWDNPELLEV